MIKNIEDLIRVCNDKWNELNNISSEYLNDAGKAALEAYKTIQWHLMFHSSMESLKYDEEFNGRPFRTAYLQSMEVYQNVAMDRFAAEEYPEE